MRTASALSAPEPASVLPMQGLEVDNLLAILALLGLLRSLELERPEWHPRASWAGPPWTAKLHLASSASQEEVAEAATAGLVKIASRFDVDGRKNVDFSPEEYRSYAERCCTDPARAALASALTSEHPEKQGGGLRAAPLILMFGQGHQNFLERLVAVPLGRCRAGATKGKPAPDLRGARSIAEALFSAWKRSDPTDAFRWDPEEDQRYAFRFGDPSKAGAASTVHGANRLAAVGFLSFPVSPGIREAGTPGAMRDRTGLSFVWPVWTQPLSLHAIERLMRHPLVSAAAAGAELAQLGVAEVYAARRIANGKFMNVTRASPRLVR